MRISKHLFSRSICVPLGAFLLFALLAAKGGPSPDADKESPDPPCNVLFIAVDDLRPQLGALGDPQMHTPHIDRLASEAVLFPHHYVQVPTCGASRFSMLTSQRPHPSRPASYGNAAFSLFPRDVPERALSLPAVFRRNGYHTVSIGKISHSPDGRLHEKTTLPGTTDDPQAPPEVPFAWDEVFGPRGAWGTAWRAFFAYAGGKSRIPGETPATESAVVSDTGYPDGLIAAAAVRKLQALKGKEQPFFLAVGFYKPHLPFNAPQPYWDFYDRDGIPPAPHPAYPEGVVPEISLHHSGELGRYTGAGLADSDTVEAEAARTLRHGYAAAISYTDAQVGKLLDALDQLGLTENTIVVLWGDHGWHLGDLGVWGKHTLYEYALRSPLLFRVPGLQGGQAQGVVESLDIFPTLVDLCGLPTPDGLDGKSLAPQLEHPRRAGKAGAFGYWQMRDRWGKTLRTERYRLTRWWDEDGTPVQTELYDHRYDPHETSNIAGVQVQVVEELLRRFDSTGEEERHTPLHVP